MYGRKVCHGRPLTSVAGAAAATQSGCCPVQPAEYSELQTLWVRWSDTFSAPPAPSPKYPEHRANKSTSKYQRSRKGHRPRTHYIATLELQCFSMSLSSSFSKWLRLLTGIHGAAYAWSNACATILFECNGIAACLPTSSLSSSSNSMMTLPPHKLGFQCTVSVFQEQQTKKQWSTSEFENQI